MSTIWAHTFTAACWTHNRPCHKSINTNRQKTTNFNWTDSFNSSCFILIFLSYSSSSLPISDCKEPDLDPENSWSASHLISEIKRKKSRCSQKLHKLSGNKQMQSKPISSPFCWIISTGKPFWNMNEKHPNKSLYEHLKIHLLYELPVPHVPGKSKAI